MSDPSAAFKALCVAAVPAAVTIEDTVVTNTDGSLKRVQYVILFGGPPDVLGDDRFTATQRPDSRAEYTFTARVVAVTADAARSLAQKLIDGLVGVKPVVAGRKCDRLTMEETTNAEPINELKPPMFFVDVDFGLTSRRA